jgi:hypothetical protein
MKSTSGAYSAFPDYYYQGGNLFGTYLRGGSSGLATGGGDGMYIATPGRSSTGPRSTAHKSELARFVKGRIGREDTIFLYEQLFPDQKLIRDASLADPWSALDRRALKHLTDADQRRIIKRLEAALTPGGKQRAPPERVSNGLETERPIRVPERLVPHRKTAQPIVRRRPPK